MSLIDAGAVARLSIINAVRPDAKPDLVYRFCIRGDMWSSTAGEMAARDIESGQGRREIATRSERMKEKERKSVPGRTARVDMMTVGGDGET